ncbi:MAG: hypothetical protein JSU65_09145, partial [Candidatus Zixiibacteriota bacterium]
LPVEPNVTSFETVVIVTDPSAALIANSEPIASGPVLPGAVTELFRLHLTNAGLPADPDIRVDSIKLRFAAASGNVFPAEPLIDPDRSGLYEDGQLVSVAYVHEDQLVFTLDNFTLTAGGTTRTVTLRLAMNYGVAESFTARLSAAGISAVYASGPHAGQPVNVSTGATSGLVFSGVFTPVTGLSLDDSFIIKDNPFDPLMEAAELQFYLPEPSDVVFRVLTLTGEEVYMHEYSECELAPGTLNTVRWDGRNDEGYTVLNGVYVAMLRIERSGEEGFLKLAVVKR